ncbi:MAG: hypothetical protein V4539_06600 [Bacteroidota bacterium]
MPQPSVNKDLLIEVLTKQNDNLEQLTQAQGEQLNNYREHAESYKTLLQKMSEQESVQNNLIESLSKEVGSLREANEDLTEFTNKQAHSSIY